METQVKKKLTKGFKHPAYNHRLTREYVLSMVQLDSQTTFWRWGNS